MTLHILNRTGHTEVLDLSTDEMVRELEKAMNESGPGRVMIAESPGQAPIYLRNPNAVKGLAETTQVTVMPQLAGG